MKSIFVSFITVLFLTVSTMAQQIAVQPSIVEFHAAPGTMESQVIRISNFSPTKLSFEAYLADWLRDSTGAHQYFKPDTLIRSCASWVQLNKKFIEIDPGKTGELIVQLRAPVVPAAAGQMKWAMLFLQSAPEEDSAERAKKQLNTRIRELVRVGVHIYQTPPAATHMSGKAIALKPVADVKNAYDLYMENTGDMMLQCKAHLELTDINSGKEYKLDRIEFPVFPEGKRKVRLVIPATVPPGKYSMLAVLDLGEGAPLEAIERTIEWK